MAEDRRHDAVERSTVVIEVWNRFPHESPQSFRDFCFIENDWNHLGLPDDAIDDGRVEFLTDPRLLHAHSGDHNENRLRFLEAFFEEFVDEAVAQKNLPFI